jgi:hypothetical protein
MAINETPVINLITGGPAVKITVECHQGPGGTVVDTTSTIAVSSSPAPTIATIAVTGAREVTVTPGASPGSISLFVSENPSADKNLQVNVTVAAPPSLREIVYVSHVSL